MEGLRQSWIYSKNLLLSPYAALILAALFWAGNFIVGRALQGDIHPVALNFWRWVLALLLLLPLTGRGLIQHRGAVLSHGKLIAALGFTGIAAFHTCVYAALAETTAINALIILSVSPVVILCISRVVFKERISRLQAAGVLVSLAGSLILICRGNGAVLVNFEFSRGDLWMGVAVPLWAAYSILLKKRPEDLPPLVLLTSSVIAGVVLMLSPYLFVLFQGQTLSPNPDNILAILYIAVFASVLAFFFWNHGVARIGPVRAGMYIHLMPFFGAFLSVWLLEEGVATYHITGALFVGTGIYFTGRKG